MDEFWIRFWKGAAVVICVAIVSMAGCSVVNERTEAELLAKMADPVAYVCARSYDQRNPYCIAKGIGN